MKKLGIVAAAAAFVGSAQAADLYVKAPIAAAYDWSGIYVGGNAGWGWADESWNFGGAFANETTRPKGGLAGGQIGAQKQLNGMGLFGFTWVLGVELTADWSGESDSIPVGIATITTKLHDLEMLTYRSGWAWNNWMFYTRSGGATGVVGVSGVNNLGDTFSQSQRLWGITSGAGIEYGLTPNWIVGVEYDYTHLWAGQFNPVSAGGVPVPFGATTAFTQQSVLGRVSYKF